MSQEEVSLTGGFIIGGVFSPRYSGILEMKYINLRNKVINIVKDTGLKLTKYSPSLWATVTAYSLGDKIKPVLYIGTTYKCIQAGTSGSSTPSWTTSGEITDGTVVWLEDNDDYDSQIRMAFRLFSKFIPSYKYAEISGSGVSDYNLPATWESEFSSIFSIEYPVNDIPASLLDSESYMLYLDSTDGLILRFIDLRPTSTFGIIYTAQRSIENLPDTYIDPFIWLVASLCLGVLATIYLQTSNATISIDSVDYQSMSKNYFNAAKEFRKMFDSFFGITTNVIPAQWGIRFEDSYPYGLDRLTHDRIERLR